MDDHEEKVEIEYFHGRGDDHPSHRRSSDSSFIDDDDDEKPGAVMVDQNGNVYHLEKAQVSPHQDTDGCDDDGSGGGGTAINADVEAANTAVQRTCDTLFKTSTSRRNAIGGLLIFVAISVMIVIPIIMLSGDGSINSRNYGSDSTLLRNQL